EHNRVQVAQSAWQQQQFHQQFQQYAKDEDAKYEEFALGFTAGQKAEIQNEAVSMLRELGLSDDQLRAEWNTNPLLRSAASQRVLDDAARYRISQRSMQSKVAKRVPAVQRPGSPAERIPESDSRTSPLPFYT